MEFIKSRKKIAKSAIASSLSIVATTAIAAQENSVPLPLIHVQADAEVAQSLKVDQSANSKFVAPLLNTPKSVSVISKQLIEDTKVNTLSDALRTVPGITLGAGEGGNPNGDRPFIRGYNSESSMYVDGIRNSSSQNREMFAIDQVEVTKGSASSMGGAGSVGGSINMISKVAKKGDSLEGSVQAGTDNYQRITLDGNKDFGNGTAARVVLMGHKNEKAGQSDGAEYKRVGIAPSITFGLDTPTRATLSYYYLRSDDTPDSGVPYNYDTTKKATVGKPVDVKQGIYYGLKGRDFQKQENHIGTFKVEHDLNENLTLSNTLLYSKSKNDYLWTQPDDSKGNVANGKVWRRINSRITDTDIFTDQLSLRGKFNTGAIKHSFNVGAEYSDQESDKGSYSTTYPGYAGSTTGGFNSDCAINDAWCTSLTNPNSKDVWLGDRIANKATTTTKTKTTGVYLLDNIEFNPQWLLDLGLRWDKFDTEQVTNATGAKIESNKDFVTYNAGITFKPTENGSIYASYATSANPVGVDGGDGSESIGQAYMDLKPEESQTIELGTKWNVLNEKLNLTAAIFRTEKQNTRIQVDSSTYTNGGDSKVDGIELSANGNITDKWAMSAGYTYLDSENTDPGPSCSRAGVCTPENAAKGKQLPNVPKNSATLWTTYKVLPQVTVGAGAFYADKVYGDAANTKWVPSYVRYDAMARYDVNKNVNLQLNLNNLSDKRYFTKAYASHYATEAEGRSAVLSVNFKY
ncbi:putative TonB-dependent receptor BfrD [Acinetobacter oleivorans]|nr:putative TonB-dependent receptor BfrD [Acinetobacter oleivorans]CAI3133496.1 putative TonB-dependent receptor BfrD [Acinetobacter oleivorans]CAI3134086.1 putative TonB-dependent receptor BfrD [Acinetobacter oleivorans]CAI3134092.1 putative TonB-dependent receptor BfrD [Acinetobacter oleivorans]CAI3134101.1 putative TonB-dependent receptor BfrD [Acinetobacter oleivorans]